MDGWMMDRWMDLQVTSHPLTLFSGRLSSCEGGLPAPTPYHRSFPETERQRAAGSELPLFSR